MMSELQRIPTPNFRRRRSQSHPNSDSCQHLPRLPLGNHDYENDPFSSVNNNGFGRKKWDLNRVKLPPAIPQNEDVRKNKKQLKSAVSTSELTAQHNKRNNSIRTVAAFTTASRMNNVKIKGPPKLGVFEPRPSPPTTFRKMYERGDIPVTLHHDHRGHALRWKVDLEKIDYHHYLPLFFDGLRETNHPYDFFSRAGVTDLLARGGDRILPVIPQLILPLKSALNTRDPRVICTVLHVIQELVNSSPHVGEALVPFYRQLLPTLNLFKNKNANLGDEIDFSQHRQENLGDLIQETLEALERKGGKDAYVNIKYMVPTYQSCISY